MEMCSGLAACKMDPNVCKYVSLVSDGGGPACFTRRKAAVGACRLNAIHSVRQHTIIFSNGSLHGMVPSLGGVAATVSRHITAVTVSMVFD